MYAGISVREIPCLLLGTFRKIQFRCREFSANMGKRKNSGPKPKKPLDRFLEKRGRGRPQNIPHSWIIGRAQNYRQILAEIWPRIEGPLLAAQTEQQITEVFQDHAQGYAVEFVPRLSSDILSLIRDPDFPKRPEAQIGFLADSLAGRPSVEARTSRDICGEERANERTKSPYKIVRKEVYIECECGCKGPARDNACRKCGAQIPPLLQGFGGFD